MTISNFSHLGQVELAKHTDSIEILKMIVLSDNFFIRYWVTKNPNAPEDILLMLRAREFVENLMIPVIK